MRDFITLLVMLGLVLIVGGIVGLIFSLSEDTAIYSSYPERIHNIGLIEAKIIHVILSCSAILTGTILFGFWVVSERVAPFDKEKAAKDAEKRQKEWAESYAEQQRRDMEYEAEVAAMRRKDQEARQGQSVNLRDLAGRLDAIIKNIAGAENVILYRFLQVVFYAILPLGIVVAAVILTR